MSEHHRMLRESLAAYAIGQLPELDRVAIAEHVATCAECRDELASLSEVVAALRAVAAQGAVDATPARVEPSADLGERIIARIDGRGVSRTPSAVALPGRTNWFSSIRSSGLARAALRAAAVIAVLAVGVAIGIRIAQPAGPPYEVIAFEQAPAGVQASGKLVAHTWGTEADLVISGLEPGRLYRVTFVTVDGSDVPGGTFIGVAGRPILCTVNAAVLRDQAALLRIFDDRDSPVLEASLTT